MGVSERVSREYLIGSRVADSLVTSGLVFHILQPEQFKARITAFLTAESQKEAKVEAEARGLLDRYAKEMELGQVDSRKMFLSIKKKLVQDKNLILQSDPTLSQEDKINHLSHVIQEGIMRDPDLEVKRDKTALLQEIKKIITHFVEREQEVRDLVRSRLAASNTIEGSEEWNILYQRTFSEIAKKRGVS